jgi:Family of unknown function (DUF6353)
MNLVPVAIANQIARNTLHLQKSSPQILFGAGVVGVVSSTVLACRATLKAEEVLQTHKERMTLVKTMEISDEYSDQDQRKDVTIVYTKTVVEMLKLYAPAIIVGGIAIAALTSSNRILTRRNAGLTAAYSALDKGFRQYRARVIDKYGEEEDRNFRYGSQEVEILNEKTGRKKKVDRVDPTGVSGYARFFDPLNSNWSRDPEYNLVFLKCQQNYANEMLRARGHVLLNDVYDSLGIPRSKAGAVVGWVLNKNNEGDNYISFGIFDQNTQEIRDFVNGYEGSILLDFNVDGVVYDKIDDIGEELSWQLGH